MGRTAGAETLAEFPASLIDATGVTYAARACGRRRPDGLWEGWLEFEREDDESASVRTTRETTQPNRTDLVYWATGLTNVYLEGAFRRATEAGPVVLEPELSAPAFDGPAVPESILDPFEAYASGEEVLRSRLSALAAWHLRNIARAHGLVADPSGADAMSKGELIELIVLAARAAAAGDLVPTRAHAP